MKLSSFFVLLFFVFSCSSANESRQKAEEKSIANSSSLNMSEEASGNAVRQKNKSALALTSSAAIPRFEDSLHRFIRTADLKFRTGNVIQTSLAIEALVNKRKGYIEQSHISSEKLDVQLFPAGDSKQQEITRFRTISNVTVRIPVAQLNELLVELQPFVQYLDHRTVSARNIAFDSYLKKLIQQRISVHSLRVLEARSPDEANAMDQLLEREMQSDREKVEDLRLDDQVAFSTVTLYIYGNEEVTSQTIPLISAERYEPGFGSKLSESLKTGWQLIVAFFLLLVKIWPLLIALLIVWLWMKNKNGRKKAAIQNKETEKGS